jgi:hypothetical protein
MVMTHEIHWIITIAPPRGNTMKFIRRPDLTPQTRIHIVMLAWLNQGVYGKMTQIAKAYRISRTLLYQLLLAATVQLDVLFSDQHRMQSPAASLEPLALLLRLEGNCSIASISAIFKRLGYQPNSVGHLSASFQAYGQGLPSTLSMPSQTVVFYLGDEIVALHTPILVTIEPHSTAMLRIELAADRSASTWKAHFDTLQAHHFSSIGLASDRGVGLVAGYREAHPEALWVSDQFHEFHDLFNLRSQWERKAYGAIAKEDDAVRKFHHAKSESNLRKRLLQYEQAQQACEHAMARYDHLDTLLQLLQEALQLCTSQGKLRTKAGVSSELTSLFHLLKEMEDAALDKILQPLQAHLDDIIVPYQQAEIMYAQLLAQVPQHILEALILAWHHDHLSHQSQGQQKHYHHFERQQWLDVADGLLEQDIEPIQTLVFDQLDSIIRASSLVEMVNGLIRPYLHSCKGHVTQEMLNLIMFYHNHHRYKSGKRKGKAPIELLTGQALQSDWVDLLLSQVAAGHQVACGASAPSRASLELLPHPLERPRPAQMSSEPVCVKAAADVSNASTRQRDKAA